MHYCAFMYSVYIPIFALIISYYASPAYADIYMQENTTDEIYLTNLLDTDQEPSKVAFNKPAAHPYGSANTRYILLTEDALVAPDQAMASTLTNTDLPYADAVAHAANQTNIDPALLHAVIKTESAYNTKAISARGARGLMQLMPGIVKQFNVSNPENPGQNILAGAKYLRELQIMFKGDIRLTLAAYNAGPGAVLKYGSHIPPFNETRLYVPKVLSLYQKLASQKKY